MGPRRGISSVQSELEPQPKAEGVHRNKSARLQGAVILDEAEILRDDIKPGTEERSHDHNHQEEGAQGSLTNDHAQMQYRRCVLRAVVPPEKRDKEDCGCKQSEGNPVRLEPQILLAAADGSFQAGQRGNQQEGAPDVNACLSCAQAKSLAGQVSR